VKYQLNNELAIRSSAGTAFYPGLATWYFQNISTGATRREPNPNLKPEKTWMVDLGLEGKYDSTGTSFSVTPYYGRITDMVSGRYDPHPTLPGVQIIRYSNVGEAEIYGVETQVSQRITDHFSAFANITLNHSYNNRGPLQQGQPGDPCTELHGKRRDKVRGPETVQRDPHSTRFGQHVL
jgi:outer membrane receptor protein involved in Fe transport